MDSRCHRFSHGFIPQRLGLNKTAEAGTVLRWAMLVMHLLQSLAVAWHIQIAFRGDL